MHRPVRRRMKRTGRKQHSDNNEALYRIADPAYRLSQGENEKEEKFMCPTNHLAPCGHSALLDETALSAGARHTHFLVVDDISSMRRVVGSLLKDLLRNIRVSEATDGNNALQMIKAAKENGTPVDFVVTDWNMPHMDGITLLRTIREAEPLQHLPVLLVTAEATRDMILAAAKAGADGYIVKPFNATTLKTKLEQILGKRARYH